MDVVIITGAAGLIGSEAAEFYAKKKFKVVGIDNDLRKYFFGENASTNWNRQRLEDTCEDYEHYDVDIRDKDALGAVFQKFNKDVKLIIHTAAQPSHDWAAKEPFTDFSVNATGTLNLLELTRQHCHGSVFIFTSTNKVYGDLPNKLPMEEQARRWEIDRQHPFFEGIDETMSIDQSLHSLFGASKAAADIMVQEYGRYFQMKTACFRGGCLTGPRHSGAMLHGFLAYLMKCCVTGREYTIFGYQGKQVRDNIHSKDLIRAFHAFYEQPRFGEVYNMGGGRKNNCSMLEAIDMCRAMTGQELKTVYVDDNRIGDHIWYVSSLRKFKKHYPLWEQTYTLEGTMREIYDFNREKWAQEQG